MVEIDLSSLEEIRGGGLVFFNNPQLCYTGNFSTYLTDASAHQCISSPRRDADECSKCWNSILYTLEDIHPITCPCLSQLPMAMNAMNSVTRGLTAGVQMTQIVMVASISVTRDSVCRIAQLWCSQWTTGLYTHINETWLFV